MLSYGELATDAAGRRNVRVSKGSILSLLGFSVRLDPFSEATRTATIAAVSVAFARFTGILIPQISETSYLIEPIRIGSSNYAFSLSTAQLVGILMIALLTWMNTRGLKLGKLVQNTFTFAKTGSLIALIVLGLFVGLVWHSDVAAANFSDLWTIRGDLQSVGATAAGDKGARAYFITNSIWNACGRVCRTDQFIVFGRCLAQRDVYGRRGQRP